jgi:transposase
MPSIKVVNLALIKVRNCLTSYLPPYSPDLNPIEKFFSKLKALLRKAAKRSIDELWKEIGRQLNKVTQSECENYLASCGYVTFNSKPL